jgi:hypothetical protein
MRGGRLLLLSWLPFSSPSIIKMNTVWRDIAGDPIHAHGGGFLWVDKRLWWYGEGLKNKVGVSKGVNAYSAPSIAGPWKPEGMVLRSADFLPIVGEINARSAVVVERPKVVFCRKNKKFVMWLHLDVSEDTAVDTWANYVFRRAGVAVSESPQGPFKPLRAIRPNGLESLDINLFVDHWGTDGGGGRGGSGPVYVVRACAKNTYLGITRLNDDLTMTEGGIVSRLKAKVEGPVIFRDPHDGTLFLIASGVHGWEPGRMHVFRAKGGGGQRVEGAEWEAFATNPTLHSRSFFSQPTAVLTEVDKDTGQPYLVYVGDNWVYGPSHSSRGNNKNFSSSYAGDNNFNMISFTPSPSSSSSSSSSSSVESAAPPSGRFNQKYNAYIGKLLTWEHTRLPYASYVMLPLFFATTGVDRADLALLSSAQQQQQQRAYKNSKLEVAATSNQRGLPRIEFLPQWDAAHPFGAANQHFGCVNGVHSLVGEGLRVACCPRSCGSCDRCGGSNGPRDFDRDCCDKEIVQKNRVCREIDEGACILPRLSFASIISGRERAFGELSASVTHGNHKWKNPGQHMWQLKQKGKDPKFWKKGGGQHSRRRRRRRTTRQRER